MTHYPPARQTRARFFGPVMVVALVVSSIAVLVWPTKTRQVRRLLTSVAESLSCEGPITAPQAVSLREVLRDAFGELTTVQISGPEQIDGSFSRDQLLEAFTQLCALTAHFHVEFTQLSVNVTDGGARAQARADANVEYQLEGRTEREHRSALFTLRWLPSGLQLTSAQVQAKIVNQPEPRP